MAPTRRIAHLFSQLSQPQTLEAAANLVRLA
jgi:hypothetical protein